MTIARSLEEYITGLWYAYLHLNTRVDAKTRADKALRLMWLGECP